MRAIVGLAGSATMSSAPTNRSLHCTLKVPVPSMPENLGQALERDAGRVAAQHEHQLTGWLSVGTLAMAPK
jgi:hypothetical protein